MQDDMIDPTIARQFDRLPPHSIEAEMCLLASMMLDRDMVGNVMSIVDREMFYQADHQIIFDVIVHLWSENRAIDAIIVREELIKRQLLEEIGGVPYIASVLNSVPSPAHGEHYASIVKEKSMLRRVITASNESLRDAYAPHEDAADVLDKVEKRFFEIADKKVAGSAVHVDEIAHRVFDNITQRRQAGLLTGFVELDTMLNGLQNGEMIILAARPSVGKSSLATGMMEGLSIDRSIPGAMFSLEMSADQLVQRMVCSRAGIDSQSLRRGAFNDNIIPLLADKTEEIGNSPIWIDDVSSLTILDLRAKARRLKMQHDIKYLVIDYMQLMDSPNKESRQQGISEISRGIKSVAKELQIPVIALSQLNRQAESRDGNRPRMSDLRESGAVEQDADVILLLYREDYYRQHEPDYEPNNITEVIVAKQRNGPTGTVRLFFDKASTKFRNYSHHDGPF